MVRPDKRSGGRVTPKATGPGPAPAQPSSPVGERTGRVSRQPVKVSTGSPAWLPVAMFALLAVGIVIILLNYLSVLPGAPTNWYLLGGLAAILGGIVAATQYR